MIILLYGPDSYRRQKKLNKIIEEYRKKHSGLSCEYFDLGNAGESLKLKEFSAQLLLFDNKKLAILKNLYEADLKEFKDFLKSYLGSKDFTILISEDKVLPPELNFVKKKAFLAEKFENLKGDKWQAFIQREIKERDMALVPKAFDFLVEEYKNDVWGLINELEKLDLFFWGQLERKNLDLKDMEKVGDYYYKSPNIFGFMNTVIRKGDLVQKTIALEKLFIGQEEPAKIFNILASLKRLPAKLIQELANYDVMVKSGKMGYEEVLLDLALQ